MIFFSIALISRNMRRLLQKIGIMDKSIAQGILLTSNNRLFDKINHQFVCDFNKNLKCYAI